MSAGRIVIDAILNKDGAEKGLSELQKSLSSSGDKMKETGKSLTKGITLPLLAAGGAGFKFALDQETAFAKVSTLLSGSEKEMNAYKDTIRNASSDMGVAFDEYAESVYGSISAGIDAGHAIDFVADNVKLARGGFTDTATAVDLTTTVMNAYGMEIEDTQRIHDVLINTQNKGKTTVDELASSMGKVIPTADAQNVSFEQLSSTYAILTARGIATSEAGTYTNAMLKELGKSGSDTDKILRDKTGKGFAELQAEGYTLTDTLGILDEHAKENNITFGDMFGSGEAATAAMTLMSDGGEGFVEVLASMDDAAGATEEAFNKMSETTSQKMTDAWVKIQNTLAQVMDLVLPLVADLADAIGDMVSKIADWFSSLDPFWQKFTLGALAIAAAIGPILVVLGMLVNAFATLLPIFVAVGKGIMFLVSVKGILILAVIALVVAIVIYWDEIKAFTIMIFTAIADFFIMIWDWIKEIWNISIEWLTEFIQSSWEWIQETTMAVFEAISEFFSMIWNAIVETVMAIIQPFIDGILNLWSHMSDGINQVMQGLKIFFTSIWEIIKNVFLGALLLIINLVTGNFTEMRSNATAIMENIRAAIRGVWEGIKTIFSGALAVVLGFVRGSFENMRSSISSLMTSIRSTISSIWSGIRTFFTTTLSNIVSSVRQRFSDMVNAVKERITSVKETITDGLNQALEFLRSINLFDIGKNIIQGLIDGISGMFGKVKEKISGITDMIPSTIKSILGIKSPSIVMRKEVMEEGVESGLLLGMEDTEKSVSQSASSLANSIIPDVGKPGIRSLSRSSERVGQAGPNNSKMEALLEKIAGSNQVVVLDSGALVGGTYNEYDRFGGNKTEVNERWGR